MSCYLRHLKGILGEAGIEVTPANRKQVDRAIHQIAGTTYKDCPETWKRLKQLIGDEQKQQEFISHLRSAYHQP
jgi:hypothetical protein